MSTNPLVQSIETLAKERGIDPAIVITAIEEAVLTASQTWYSPRLEFRLPFRSGPLCPLCVFQG